MEEKLDNGANNYLYMKNDTSRYIETYLITVSIGNLIVFFLLLSDTILYTCCRIAVKMYVKRCSYCTDPTSTEMVREHSKTMRVVNMFCTIIERWKVWLLVDLFRTPKVKKKQKINGKLHLKIGEYHSGQVGEGVFRTALIFACVSVILCTYIGNFIGDSFLKVTPTCFHKGDFDVPAVCYAPSPIVNGNVISYRINCTTWNIDESAKQELGLLFCFSFYFDILASMTEIIGMFGLQTLIAQVTLTIVGKVWRNNKCFIIFIIVITIMVPITIFCKMQVLQTTLMFSNISWNEKQLFETESLQPSPLIISISTFILSILLLISTNDSRKTRNTTPTPSMTEEQSNGDTDPLLTKESPQIQDPSVDRIHSETTQGEDTTIVEIHPYTTEEVRTTREHNKGVTGSVQQPTGREDGITLV